MIVRKVLKAIRDRLEGSVIAEHTPVKITCYDGKYGSTDTAYDIMDIRLNQHGFMEITADIRKTEPAAESNTVYDLIEKRKMLSKQLMYNDAAILDHISKIQKEIEERIKLGKDC